MMRVLLSFRKVFKRRSHLILKSMNRSLTCKDNKGLSDILPDFFNLSVFLLCHFFYENCKHKIEETNSNGFSF